MKLKFLSFFLLIVSIGLNAQDFPLTQIRHADWVQTGDWKNAADITLLPWGNQELIASAGTDVLYATAKENTFSLNSKRKFSDFKFEFEFIQSTETEAELVLGDALSISLNNSVSEKSEKIGTLKNSKGKKMQPIQNVAKQAGLWQKAKLVYSAPKGKMGGILEVLSINGIPVFENYITVNHIDANMAITFRLTKGTLALRNVQYADYGNTKPVTLSNLKYKLQEHYGWEKMFEVKNEAPVYGKSDVLTFKVQNDYKHYKISYTGDINIEKTGLYVFKNDFQGISNFKIDGKDVASSDEHLKRVPITGLIELEAGKHSFEYMYHRIWWPPAFGLSVAGAGFRSYALQPEGTITKAKMVNGIYESAEGEDARILRSFMHFKGEKRTKVISVGSNTGIHYAFDLANGGLLYAWKGDFADVTEMWHHRGEPQVLKPMGQKITLAGKSNFSNKKGDELVFEEYYLDQAGIPTYLHSLGGISVSRKFEPAEKGLLVTISANSKRVNYVLAESQNITKLNDLLYKTDDYYIVLESPTSVKVNSESGLKQLVGIANEIGSYTISW